MFSTSDILTQQVIEKKGLHHDFRRTLRMYIMGVIIGPIQRTWFLTLERLLPPTSKMQILKKLIVDQTIYGPFIIFFFYSLSGTLSGKDISEIKEVIEEKYLRTLITGYKVWPFVCKQLILLLSLFNCELILFKGCLLVGICTYPGW